VVVHVDAPAAGSAFTHRFFGFPSTVNCHAHCAAVAAKRS
jgi:hypothetical protein